MKETARRAAPTTIRTMLNVCKGAKEEPGRCSSHIWMDDGISTAAICVCTRFLAMEIVISSSAPLARKVMPKIRLTPLTLRLMRIIPASDSKRMMRAMVETVG